MKKKAVKEGNFNELVKEAICCETPFSKTCTCGAVYTLDSWRTLRYRGIMSGMCPDGKERVFDDLEIRRCICGSGLAVRLDVIRRREKGGGVNMADNDHV